METRSFKAEKRYLLIPVDTSFKGYMRFQGNQFLSVFVDGEKKEEIDFVLSKTPAYYYPMEIGAYRGKMVTIELEGGDEGLIDLVVQSDEEVLTEKAKNEVRPVYHVTAQYGRLNDPNGLFYLNGTYHYFSQVNPYGLVAGNTSWLHQTSPDLLHYTYKPLALTPDETGRMYSGSAVVDYENTSGLGDGKNPPVLLFYTAAGSKTRWSRGKQFEIAIAVSRDCGETFTKYEGNPVVPFIRMYNRDPKVIWDEKNSEWVMAIFVDRNDYLLLHSKNLLEWEKGDLIVMAGAAECPDIFFAPLDEDPEKMKLVVWGSPDCYIVGILEDRHFRPETPVQSISSKQSYIGMGPMRRGGGHSYAAQTYYGLPGGRILQQSIIRNMNAHEVYAGTVGFPQEVHLVSVKEGMMLSLLPAEEIKKAYVSDIVMRNQTLEDFGRLPADAYGDAMDLSIDITLPKGELIAMMLKGMMIVYDDSRKTLILPIGAFSVPHVDKELRLRFLTDHDTMEIFTADGLFSISIGWNYSGTDYALKPLFMSTGAAYTIEIHKIALK